MQQMLLRCQWSRWGYQARPKPVSPSKTRTTQTVLCAVPLAEDDDDFSTKALIHRRRRLPEADTEDMQLAVALSRNAGPARKRAKKEVNLDAASILSIDESRTVVRRELVALLAKSECRTQPLPHDPCPPPSRLLQPDTRSFWQVANLGQPSPDLFSSRFMQKYV
ncbi:hypothetical protein BCR43DRAFT_481491 [Syncephalastrum racemosum]|uniref:Uncharacterized protein n=1 Tax=Syncephalastrum racemosum TaxID=13706 RepID=A0A1X2HS70_SYNRA|nr:hypothetical protein BCR43DRAFT_481491 [Syncephalastrum racemosum]